MVKPTIQNFIRDIARNFVFFRLSYGKDGDASIAFDIEIKPIKALCNEVQSDFGPDKLMGLRQAGKRIQWMFELDLEFAVETSIEDFERYWIDEIRHIPRDLVQQTPDISIRLVQSRVRHPAQKDSNKGTEAILAFAIELGTL